MDRRALLGLVGLAFAGGCASNPPRATGPRTPPTPGEPTAAGESGSSLAVTDQGVDEAAEGHLRVVVTVTNRGGTERTNTLVVVVSIDGERTERRREVTVPGGDAREVAVDFETVAYDDFAGGGSLQSRLE